MHVVVNSIPDSPAVQFTYETKAGFLAVLYRPRWRRAGQCGHSCGLPSASVAIVIFEDLGKSRFAPRAAPLVEEAART